jgi:protein required for attachment to host cells
MRTEAQKQKKRSGVSSQIPHVVRLYLAANRAEALIYKEEKSTAGKFELLTCLNEPDSRLHEGDLDSDAPGTGFSSAGGGTIHHGLDRTFHKHEQLAKNFVRKIMKSLSEIESEEHFSELVLVAEPHFLGLLKAALPVALKNKVTLVKTHEFTSETDAQIQDYLRSLH